MNNSLITRNILKLGAYLKFKAYAQLRKMYFGSLCVDMCQCSFDHFCPFKIYGGRPGEYLYMGHSVL